jgi:periplasmic copper chaperone A
VGRALLTVQFQQSGIIMKNLIATKIVAACAGSIWATAAFSHISLENKSAAAGSSYKAVFQVGHGCDGSATKGIAVDIPSGFRGTKPMPKAGWTVTTQVSKLASPYESHGKQVLEDVTRVSWVADSKKASLPDAQFDQFTMRGNLSEATGPMWFKVLQTCEKGSTHWREIPSAGVSTAGLQSPAPMLLVTSAVAVPALSLVAAANEPITVSNGWVRATVAGQKGSGAFMKITVKEGTRLTSVSSPVAGVAEVHEMKMEGDVMKMRAVPMLDIPAGGTVELKPGGYHLMLMDLKQALPVGSTWRRGRFGEPKGPRALIGLPTCRPAVSAACSPGGGKPLRG